MSPKDDSQAAGSKVKKKAVKKKAVKKKAVKKKAVSRVSLDEPVDIESSDDAVEEEAEAELELDAPTLQTSRGGSQVASVSAVQDTITTRATRTVRSKDITVFMRQMIMMLDAGTPILKCLKSLANRGERRGIRNLVGGIAEYVEAGNPLWQAFAREGRHFSPIYVNLIKAAEASGSLTTVLRRLVDYREKRESMRRNLTTAMIYPVSITVIAYLVIWMLATFLIPEFRSIFEQMDVEMPGFTTFVMGIAQFIGGFGMLATVFIVALALWGGYVWFAQSPLRRVAVDRVKMRLPIIGPITQADTVAEFTRTFAMLQRSGVLMMSTLELCRNSITNRAFADAIQDMRDSVERGDGLEAPLRSAERRGLLPGVVVDMLITGEETGSMDQIADQIADSYEEEVEIRVHGLKEAIQPVAVVALGIVVGGTVIALFMPMLSLITSISEQGF